MRVNTSAKRLDGELKYDYCCRRELERHRLAILKLGLPLWTSHRLVLSKDKRSLVKQEIQGTYVRGDKHRRDITKAMKKRYKKAQRAYKFASNAQV